MVSPSLLLLAQRSTRLISTELRSAAARLELLSDPLDVLRERVENPHAGERRESTTACRAKQHSPGAKRTGGSGMRSLLLLAQSGTVDAAAAVRSPGDIGAVRNILASLVTGSL